METTRDLINAIAAGDAIQIENTFNAAMAEKISGALDDRRIEVAQSLFVAQEEPSTEE